MFAIDTLDRANGFPQIAIDPKGKRLYVSWSDYRNGDLDIFVASSDDRGKHWTVPDRVNDDSVHNGAEQFFQWMAVDPVDGSVNVIFYDRRRDPQNRKQFVVLARSLMAAGNSTTMHGRMNRSKQVASSSVTTVALRRMEVESTERGPSSL